ncbi:MAG: alpha/beta hydrolase, partial [Actinobacteria bacterium]|nr:alpha/beta hydrolase [Actinomycetota bacterium]
MANIENFELSDSRKLELLDNYVDSSNAIIFHHGTPGDVTTWSTWVDLCKSKGIRAISYSRAGYGLSDRNKNRIVSDVNKDIEQVLKAKGIKRFVSIGWSGGGPHALANIEMAENCAAISLAGVGAFGQPDLDFLADMGQENHDEFGAALAGFDQIEEWMAINGPAMQTVTGDQVRESLGGLIGAADKAVIEGAYADAMAANFRRALANGFSGWIDDDIAFIEKWGFELENIRKPVFLWQGDQDLMVPHAHGQW